MFEALRPILPADGLLLIDSTTCKAHRAASGAAHSTAAAEALGRGRGGLCSKLHACADGAGRILRLIASPGNHSDLRYLRGLPDFDDVEAEDRAIAHALAHEDRDQALAFLVAWPNLEAANRLVRAHHEQLDGRDYGRLRLAADALAERSPAAASLLHRRLGEDVLRRAASRYYQYAARDVLAAAGLAPMWSADELGEQWSLRPEDMALLAGMVEAGKLGFAAQLAFWRQHGRFPADEADLAPAVVAHLAAQIGVGADVLEGYAWAARSGRRHRLAILDHLAVASFDEAAEGRLRTWLTDDVLPRELAPAALDEELGAWFARSRVTRPGAYLYRRAMMNGSTRNQGCFPAHVG